MAQKHKITFFIVLLILIIFSGIFYYLKLQKKEYIIGSSLSLKGIMGDMGEAVKLGTEVSFNVYKNRLKNRVIYKFLDDKYEPQLTFENIKTLYNHNLFLLYGIIGTPTVKKVLPFLSDNSLFLYAPFSGANFLRQNRYVLNFRASYKDEIKKIINYLTKKNISKFAVFYQDDEYGNEIYYYTHQILKEKNLSLKAKGPYKRNTFVIDFALREISSQKPQAIIMGSTSEVSAMFIKRYKKINPDVLFCTISFINPDKLISLLEDKKNIIFSTVVPYYNDSSIKEAVLFKKELKKLYPNKKPSFLAFEAYLVNKILLNALQQLTFPYTSSHLMDIIKSTPKNFLKGISIEFKNNQLSNKTFLFKYENNKFKELK